MSGPGRHFIAAHGVRLHVAEWARRTGLSQRTIAKRLAAGWPATKAVFKPSRQGKPNRCGWCFEIGHGQLKCPAKLEVGHRGVVEAEASVMGHQ